MYTIYKRFLSSKFYFILLFSLITLTASTVCLGDNNPEVSVLPDISGGGNEIAYNTTFNINLLIKYNKQQCGNFKLQLIVPTEINANSITLGSNNTIGARFEKTSAPYYETVGGQKVISISFDNMQMDGNWSNNLISIVGFKTPQDACDNLPLELKGKLISNCSEAEDIRTIIIKNNAAISIVSVSMPGTDITTNGKVFYVDIKLSKNRNNNSLFEKLDFLVDIGTTSLQVVAVSSMAHTYWYKFNDHKIEHTIDGTQVSFSDDSYNAYFNNEFQYRIYYDVICSSGTFTPNLNISIIPYNACTHLPSTDLTYSTQRTYTCYDDNARLSKPEFNVYFDAPCVNACYNTEVRIELDNIFNISAYINNAATFTLDVPVNVNPVAFYIDESQFDITVPQTIKVYTCNSSSYTITGATGYRANSFKFDLTSLARVEKIEITYPKIGSTSATDVALEYNIKNYDCNNEETSSVDDIFHCSINVDNIVIANKDINLNTSSTTCRTENIQEYFYTNGGFNNANLVFTAGEERYAMLWLAPTRQDPDNNFSFTYNLNSNLEIADHNIKFLTLINPTSPSMFMDFNEIRAQFPDEFGSLNYNISGNSISVNHINLNFSCGDGSNFLFVLVKVKVRDKANAGTFNNSLTPKRTTTIFSSAWWTVLEQGFGLTPILYSTCENSIVDNKVKFGYAGGMKVKPSDIYSYQYVVKNEGNGKLKDIIVIGTIPSPGDKKILSDVARNSEFAVARNCPFNLVAKEFDENNTFVANVPIEYSFEPASNVNESDFNLTSWSSTNCSELNNQAVKFKTLSTYNLSGYNYMVITFDVEIPTDISSGKKANSTFAVRASSVSTAGLNSHILESSIVGIEVAASSSCDIQEYDCRECVPSFSPMPGQRYLLSAWVKEDYIDKYPETYKNSGVLITFNGGTITTIPLMKPSGPIIDGWQRIEQAFIVPADARNIQIQLVNDNAAGSVYFDDIRIHPFRSNMKSFVYDPSTQKLTAELDENNYATLYEYDDEGILIRVKKETERGVMTIKETRNNQSKLNK